MPIYRLYLSRLKKLHDRFNGKHFGNELGACLFAVNPKWTSTQAEIEFLPHKRSWRYLATFSLALLKEGTASSIRRCLLHEMIHQWQHQNSESMDHGAEFNRKARELRIEPSASATVSKKSARSQGTPR